MHKTTAALLLLAGCGVTIRETKGPAGQLWREIDCSGQAIAACLDAAAEVCGGAYQPVHPDMTVIGPPGHVTLFGTTIQRRAQVLYVECPDPRVKALKQMDADIERARQRVEPR